ncbi:MAG TPA: FAD binding domain-containing protein [Candidatus Limnocylindrales bacterium]|nr:FAD binding domain-containing protein [Candidatus Limnocylindrales bacterium]
MLRRLQVHRATSIDEAIALRVRFGDDAAVYAGGTELLLAMKLGVARWPHLIDVKPIAELHGVTVASGTLRIGAAVTHWELERDAAVARAIPAFAELERHVANVRVRAAGTLAGNIAFAEPHADPPTLLAALGASIVVRGSAGERVVPIAEFTTGMYQTTLAADEIIVAIEVPVPAASKRVAYVKFQILERPSVGVAMVAEVRDGRFAEAPVMVIGAVDEVPRRVATDPLRGADARAAATLDALADAARGAVEPVADLAGDADYKRHLVGVFARRAVDALLAQAA